MMTVELSACTDRGCVRTKNEDCWDIICTDMDSKTKTIQMDAKGILLAVADGMGGSNSGEVASHIAIETLRQEFSRMPKLLDSKARLKWLAYIIEIAHNNIINKSLRKPEHKDMGTTVVVAWILNDSAHIAWVGDSRCYLHRAGRKFEPFTDDHSLVWEQVKKGTMNAEQARFSEQSNVILESLGDPSKTPKVDCRLLPLQQGDRLLLCSDGLNSMLSDKDIEKIFTNPKSDPNVLSDQLVWAATAAGGYDNVTVLTAHISKGRQVATTEGAERRKMRNRALTFALTTLLLLLATAFILSETSEQTRNIPPNNKGVAESTALVATPAKEIIMPTIEPPSRSAQLPPLNDTLALTTTTEELLGYNKTKRFIRRIYQLQYEKFEIHINKSVKLANDKCPELSEAELDALIDEGQKSIQYLDAQLATIPGIVWDSSVKRTVAGYTNEFSGTSVVFFEKLANRIIASEKSQATILKINHCQSLNK